MDSRKTKLDEKKIKAECEDVLLWVEWKEITPVARNSQGWRKLHMEAIVVSAS
jgi:hypothetical protein